MGLLEIKQAWELEKNDGWGTEYNTRFANLVVPYEGNEFMHQMAKVFHSGFTQGQRFIDDERKKEIEKLKDYLSDQEKERIKENENATNLYVRMLELEDMLISCLPYITDSYDDNTISKEGHSHAKKLEQRIRERLTTASTGQQ